MNKIKEILFLPLDDRPPNLQFVQRLADMAGVRLRRIARIELKAKSSTIGLISLDGLVYGGLVPAREMEISTKVALRRLEFFKELRRRFPKLRLYATASILRSFPSRGSWNEAPVRARNEEVLRRTISYVSDGILDFLLIGQEDSGRSGPGRRERNRLEVLVKRLRVTNRVLFVNGTDELSQLLLARILLEMTGRSVDFSIDYSTQASARAIPLYEDRPLRQNVLDHIRVLKHSRSSRHTVTIPLLIHGHSGKMADLMLSKKMPSFCKSSDRDIQKILRFPDGRVAVADVGCANGACKTFASRLVKILPRFNRLYYAAWNTAGNTLGTVLAWAAIDSVFRPSSRWYQSFLFERLLDDYIYQSIVRRQFREPPDVRHLHDRIQRSATRLGILRIFRNAQRFQVKFPWQRLFEIEIDAILKLP